MESSTAWQGHLEQPFNSLLDKAEDPKKSLDLTIEEMAQSLREAKKEIVESLGTQKRSE